MYTGNQDSTKENSQAQVVSYDSLSADGPFAEGQIRLIKGDFPEDKNEIVVNQNLAEMNQWELGDTICANAKLVSANDTSGFTYRGRNRSRPKAPWLFTG